MRNESQRTKAESMFEDAMENVFGHARDAESACDDLSCLVDEFISEEVREKADALIDRILVSLGEIG